MGASRLIGIIGVPGDRDNSTIKAIGSIAATIFDKIIIKEDSDLRNRKKGEVAKLLEEGVLSQGMGKDHIEVILSETQALNKAISEALPGDLIVIYYEKLEPVLDIIKKAMVDLDSRGAKQLDQVQYRKNRSRCVSSLCFSVIYL